MQSYANHAHRPTPTLVAAACWLVSAVAYGGSRIFGWPTGDLAFIALLLAVFVAISIDRLYTTKLQDRIIMLELKVRCAELLPAGADAQLRALGPKQMTALRFASDAELGPLLERAVREQLTPDDIKKAVRDWRPDFHRT